MSDSRIRIAHVVGSLTYGGAENQVVRIVSGLDSTRFSKYLVTFVHKTEGQDHLVASEVNRYIVGKRGIKKLFHLARFLRNERIQIVQTHMYAPNLIGSLAARLAGVPVIITTEHGKNTWKRMRHHMVERFIINPIVSMRVAVSKDILRLRKDKDHVPGRKIIFIGNCVDIPDERHFRAEKEQTIIGTVGRLVPAKDYRTLLIAAKDVIAKRPDVKFIFVGDGEEREMLEKTAASLNIASHIEFLGWQSDVGHYLDQMDLFVLSSITEGIPVALLEAMVKGIPIVATNVGGIPEVIQDGLNGLLVQAGHPENLAHAILNMLEHEDIKARLGRAARARIIESFAVTQICREYATLYEALLSEAKRGLRS